MAVTVFGIANCDTIRAARAWLSAHGVMYRFHDYKRDGADPAQLARWAGVVGWEALLNRAGTTFRKLPEIERHALDQDRAVALMAAHPSAIRRPVVEHDDGLLVGFDASRWEQVLG